MLSALGLGVGYVYARGRGDEPAPGATARRAVAVAPAAATPAPAPDSAASAPPKPPAPRPRPAPLTAAEARALAERADGFRLVVSLGDRHLWVIDGRDTLRSAPVGIGMDSTLRYKGRVWRFRTPRGERRVLGKDDDPVWTPPDWHYVEVAQKYRLPMVQVPRSGLTLDDGSRIEVRDDEVGLVRPDEPFTPFAHDEEIIWDSTLFVPPIGTKQRAITGELGRYRLELGDGYLLHGTPHTESIGQPSSHGCIRLGDEDIAWLYENVPVGTKVYTY